MVGILLAVAGTISTAYTAFKPPEWMSYPEVQAAKEDTIRIVRTAMERGWDHYPPEDKIRAFDEARQVERDETVKLQGAIARAWHAERRVVAKANLWGVVLIALGSACQGLAIVLGP
jgi:hypothetical protein